MTSVWPTCQFPDCTQCATPMSMVVSPNRGWEFVWLCDQHREIMQAHPIEAHWATEPGLGENWARERDSDHHEQP
jgi:hypothetical protein